MGDVINLNQHRKSRRRADDRTRAEENRQRFGRTKEQREREAQDKATAERRHDLLRLDPTTPDDSENEPPSDDR